MKSILKRVYYSKRIALSLKIISHACALLCVASYLAMLISAFLDGPTGAVRLGACAAIPFIAVSIIRKLIDAPRPYELYDFYEIKPKEKKGESFPSRHVFSAFVIATLAYTVSLPLSVSLFAVGISLAVCRVLLGMHFIRDVAAGMLIGIVSGIIGIMIII